MTDSIPFIWEEDKSMVLEEIFGTKKEEASLPVILDGTCSRERSELWENAHQ